MTKADILARVVAHFQEEPTPVRWTQEEIYRHVDDALDEMAERVRCVFRIESVPVAADEHIVDVPPGFVCILTLSDVTTPLQSFPIDPVHWTRIAWRDIHFMTARGTRPETFAAFGLTKILLNRAYAAPGVLEFHGQALPVAIGPSGTPPVMAEFHEGLVEYVKWRCRLKDISAGDDLGRAMKSRRGFDEMLARIAKLQSTRHPNIDTFETSPKRIT